MSGLFNRLKSRRTGTISDNESITSSPSFDEQGFLCPSCHQKFNDPTQLAQHYADTHAEESISEKKNGSISHPKEIQQNPSEEIALWKQQFTASEESRILLSNELMHEKERAGDLEEELQLLQKHLKSTQAKVAEQTQEIANFKATRDVYDAQLTIFSNELLAAQNQLKQKQEQIDAVVGKSTDHDTTALQRELLAVQQRMHEVSTDKDGRIEKLRSVLRENYQYSQQLDQIGANFDQSLSMYDELISKNAPQVESDINQIKQFVRLTRARKEKVQNVIQSMRNRLIENQTQITRLNADLAQQKLFTNDLLKQTNSSRTEIESLTKEIEQLESSLNELREEKNQLIQSKMTGDQDDQRQNLVRQITHERDQYEQQIKDLRIQMKKMTNERQQIQEEFEQISKQFALVSNEKSQLNSEIDSLKNQFGSINKDKERRMNELAVLREQYQTAENNLREASELNNTQTRDLERLRTDLTEQIHRLGQEKTDLQQLVNQTKIELTTAQKEKENIVQQLQTVLAQLHAKLDERETRIKRLSFGIRRSVTRIRKIHEHIHQNIDTNQSNVLATIEKAKDDSRSMRAQTFEELQEDFTLYLSTVQTLILDSKNTLAKQMEIKNLCIVEEQERTKKVRADYEKLLAEHREQKQKYELQLGELNKNLLQVSESLSQSTQTADRQREKYEKQITAFERELESRTKRHEMQLAALTENLAAVRTELKLNHEKLAQIDQIKAEKADIEARLVVGQDERRVLLERSLTIESKNEKLINDNGQFTKKITELERALQEVAREYQVLQIQANKLSQRRWIDDEDVDACMKCSHTFTVRQRKHHCRNCGNIFCDNCSSKSATIAASSKKKRVCDQCYKDLTA